MKSLKLALVAATLLSANASALDASSLKLQVYSVMLSTSPQCTSPVTVFSSATPTEVDFLATPTLGSGNPPDGTYHCVIIKMSDLIKFTPSTTAGLCSASVQYTADVCRTDNGGITQAPDAVGAPSSAPAPTRRRSRMPSTSTSRPTRRQGPAATPSCSRRARPARTASTSPRRS